MKTVFEISPVGQSNPTARRHDGWNVQPGYAKAKKRNACDVSQAFKKG